MAVGTYALVSLVEAKEYLHLDSSDLSQNALTIYNSSGDATAATVEVTSTALSLVVTGGANAGTSTLTLSDAANDTLTELVAAVDALSKGWVVNLEGNGLADSEDLTVVSATDAFLVANEQTLVYTDNWLIENIIDDVTDIIERVCHRKLVSRSYSGERYDGQEDGVLYLKQYPVTQITRVSIGKVTAGYVTNASSDAADAYVEVTSTGLTLTIVGGTNAGSDTVTFASYTTLSTLCAAIIALGKNWSCTVSTGYGSHPSSDLFPQPSFGCLDNSCTLYVPSKRESEFELYENTGKLILKGVPLGYRNVAVDYTAGLTTVPDALRNVACDLVGYSYARSRVDPTIDSEEQSGRFRYRLKKDDLTPNQYQHLGFFTKITLAV